MRDFSADHRWLSLNTATVRKQADLLGMGDHLVKEQKGNLGDAHHFPTHRLKFGALFCGGIAQRLNADRFDSVPGPQQRRFLSYHVAPTGAIGWVSWLYLTRAPFRIFS